MTNTDTYNVDTLEKIEEPTPEMLAKAQRITTQAEGILRLLNDHPMPDIDEAIDACCSAIAYLISGLPDDKVTEQYNLTGHKIAAGIAMQKTLGFTPTVAMLNAERPQ